MKEKNILNSMYVDQPLFFENWCKQDTNHDHQPDPKNLLVLEKSDLKL